MRSLALLVMVLCGSSATIAAPGTSGAPAPILSPQDEAAQQAFREGVDAARQERWEAARAAFERAYGLAQRPVVLINLAGAQARTGRLTAAAKNYHRILDEEGGPENASFKKAAADILPELEARIPRVRIRASGLMAEDIVQIDDEPVERQTLLSGHLLDPGDHLLVVTQGGRERARVLFTLSEREQREIALPLPPLVRPPVEGGSALLGEGGGGTTETAHGEPQRRWWKSPWTWTAVAAVLVAGGVTAFVLYQGRDQPYDGNIPPGHVPIR